MSSKSLHTKHQTIFTPPLKPRPERIVHLIIQRLVSSTISSSSAKVTCPELISPQCKGITSSKNVITPVELFYPLCKKMLDKTSHNRPGATTTWHWHHKSSETCFRRRHKDKKKKKKMNHKLHWTKHTRLSHMFVPCWNRFNESTFEAKTP